MADAALGELDERRAVGRRKIGTVAADQLRDHGIGERPKRQPAAARADGRQKTAGIVAHQDQERPVGRLLQDFQHRVRGVAVHLVGGVHDHGAPAALCGRQAQERRDRPSVLDHDLRALALALGIDAALDGQQVRMAVARDPAEHRVLRRQRERSRRRGREETARARLRALTQQKPRDAERQRRLADAVRSRDQQPMRQAAGREGSQQLLLGRLACPRRSNRILAGRGHSRFPPPSPASSSASKSSTSAKSGVSRVRPQIATPSLGRTAARIACCTVAISARWRRSARSDAAPPVRSPWKPCAQALS